MSAAHNSVRRRLLLGGAAVAGLAAAGAAAGSAVMARADFGALPTGERLKRIQASPHWQDGSFHNLVPMELSASGRSRLEIMRDFLLDRNPQRFPSAPCRHQNECRTIRVLLGFPPVRIGCHEGRRPHRWV